MSFLNAPFNPPRPAQAQTLAQRLALGEVLSVDRGRLLGERKRLLAAGAAAGADDLLALERAIAVSRLAVQARARSVPMIACDESLPIASEAGRIVELIRKHPVLVVAGETGSGKTTQLPKLCLAAGRGLTGLIGCTQPRRIAARSVARRVAEELATPLGDLVGWQVRFTEVVGERALIKFMTDGILLAETQSDRWLARYDTLIIDEAHERSLNIDFLLGYLRRLLAKRRDLKVIITSATIDTGRFAQFFGGAPTVHVEGRSWPVEVRWRPPADDAAPAQDLTAQLLTTVAEISATDPLGDILVFLPGEREIRDAHLALSRRTLRATEVLPLYARLSGNDQDRVFRPGVGRRIVLATNVAETSLTVPRIRHVIDPGLARINRYAPRHKVQRLLVEPIAQANAQQRAGRCGRTAPGICWRLYDEADFARRPPFADPELKRSALAGVILRLLSLGLGPIEDFPFIDPPSERAINDGYQQLLELGAISVDRQALSACGRDMAQLPIDVQLARVMVEARVLGALGDALVIVSFASIQDPRERPAEARALADSAHAHYHDPASDFVAIIALWAEFRQAHEDLTQSKLRAWCELRFLNYLRMREWRELHRQLVLRCAELRWPLEPPSAPTDAAEKGPLGRRRYEALHRSLIAGFPANLGRRDEKTLYIGTRGRRYQIHPGSGLSKKPPQWLLSATLLETARLYGLTNAAVEPEWIEQQCAHLIRKRHFDPHWSRAQGRVLGYEAVTLLGLSLVERRRVAYERIDPAASHAVFVREALLSGEIDCRAAFVARNQRLLEQARDEEARQRKRGLLRDDEELALWLAQRIPDTICNTVALDTWYKSLDRDRRSDLEWTLDDLLRIEAVPERAFPKSLGFGRHRLILEYRFEPGDPLDGVSVRVPLELLNALSEARLSWLVPGLLEEKVTALIRNLPKALRRELVPAPDFARAFIDAIRLDEISDADLAQSSLAQSLSAHFERMTGTEFAPELWDERELPGHLRFGIALLDERGQALAQGRDLADLRTRFGARARAEFARVTASDLARESIVRWDFDQLPAEVTTDSGLAAYPALIDRGTEAAILVFENRAAAAAAHPAGVLRLLALELAEPLKRGARKLPLAHQAAIAWTTIDSPDALRADLIAAAFDDLAGAGAAQIRTRDEFLALKAAIERGLFAAAVARLQPVEATLIAYAELAPRLTPELLGFATANYDDARRQLSGLVYAGFARALSVERLQQLPRYLKGLSLRLPRLVQDPRKDQARMLEVQTFSDWLRRLQPQLGGAPEQAQAHAQEQWQRLRWLIEEFRVQLFAQEMKTREPVSGKRLNRQLADLEALLNAVA